MVCFIQSNLITEIYGIYIYMIYDISICVMRNSDLPKPKYDRLGLLRAWMITAYGWE